MFMIIVNNVFWLFVCLGFFNVVEDRLILNSNHTDFVTDNNFIATAYDAAFALWIFGSLAIYIWTKFALYFFSRYQRYRKSPVELWAIKNLSIWGYAILGLLLFPNFLLLPAIPGLYMLETIQLHIGDAVMRPIFTGLMLVVQFFD